MIMDHLDTIIAIVGALLVGGLSIFFWLRRRPKPIKTDYFQSEWRAMQKLCGNKETWPQAIVAADNLLDQVLKKKRFSGKSMGERLTHAQRLMTNNEGVWFGHKLRSKIDADPTVKLKEAEVKQALVGIRQAMKDLGAFAPTEAAPAMPTATPTPNPTAKAKSVSKPKPPAKTAAKKPVLARKKESKK